MALRQSVEHWLLVGCWAPIFHQYLPKMPYWERCRTSSGSGTRAIISYLSHSCSQYLIFSSTQTTIAFRLKWVGKQKRKISSSVCICPNSGVHCCSAPTRPFASGQDLFCTVEKSSHFELVQSLYQFKPFAAHKDQKQVPFKFNNNRLSKCKQIQWKM